MAFEVGRYLSAVEVSVMGQPPEGESPHIGAHVLHQPKQHRSHSGKNLALPPTGLVHQLAVEGRDGSPFPALGVGARESRDQGGHLLGAGGYNQPAKEGALA